MRNKSDRLRAILVLLLVSSAVLFAIGTAVEHHHHQEATASVQESTQPTEGSSESGAGESGESHPAAAGTDGTESEKLFGFNPEAPWVIATGVAASMLLALGVWALRRRWVLVLGIVFGLALAALDLRELVHQVNESRLSLVVVSVVLAILHLLVATTAGLLLRAPKGVAVAA